MFITYFIVVLGNSLQQFQSKSLERAWLPPERASCSSLLEVWLRHCNNHYRQVGEPKYAFEVVKKIRFKVNISCTMDETTDFAGIVLPHKLEFMIDHKANGKSFRILN